MDLFRPLEHQAVVDDILCECALRAEDFEVGTNFVTLDQILSRQVFVDEGIVAPRCNFIEKCFFTDRIALNMEAGPFFLKWNPGEGIKLLFELTATPLIEEFKPD